MNEKEIKFIPVQHPDKKDWIKQYIKQKYLVISPLVLEEIFGAKIPFEIQEVRLRTYYNENFKGLLDHTDMNTELTVKGIGIYSRPEISIFLNKNQIRRINKTSVVIGKLLKIRHIKFFLKTTKNNFDLKFVCYDEFLDNLKGTNVYEMEYYQGGLQSAKAFIKTTFGEYLDITKHKIFSSKFLSTLGCKKVDKV